MLTNTGPAKLYLSIIDDVIDSMRELFLDEGLEDRVLDDLRHLWESKMMQSKAMEDFRNNNINSSNFVLQLPASYTSVVIPASQNVHSFPVKNSSETLATFSLPAALAYPVQIPAGVTLQTASGQLYKVNVPVVVTQAPAGQQPVSQPTQKVTERREAPASQPAAVQPHPILPHEVEPSSVPASSVTQPKTSLAPSQESCLPQLSPEPEGMLAETEPSPQPEPVNLSMTASPGTQLLDFQISAKEVLTQTAQTRDVDDILKQDPLNSGDDVIEQDIPDLFDTDNVIVCQYDKIHRSKNRWKFHLKDGVMCYRGRDYVFSKAVGEAEW
uniref:Uncharacterized protein n=1 Tax=Amphiprion ocellaris TaxID=80972 RepID=A0A3Q1AL97_AMPOC